MTRNVIKYLIIYTCGILLILAASFFIITLDDDTRIENIRAQLQFKLADIKGKQENEINTNMLMLRGLAAHISLNPDINQQEYSSIAAELLRFSPTLVNLAVAKDLVISHVFPFEENSKIIGLDYRKLPDQFDVVSRAINSRKMQLAGPLELVQGGQAIIARLPVFIKTDSDDPVLWGIASAPMNFQKFLQQTGVEELNQSFDVAMRGRNGEGDNGDVFFGNADLFNQQAVRTTINIPGGSWVLTAMPRNGWSGVLTTNWAIWLFTLLAMMTWSFIALLSLQRSREREKTRKLLEQSQKSFEYLFEHASDAIFLINPDTGFYITANEPAQNLVGYSLEELRKMMLGDLSDPKYREKARGHPEMLRDGKKQVYDWDLVHKEGQVIPVEVSARIIEIDDHRVMQTIARDRSAQRRHEHELMAAKREAEIANHAKSQFLANMSHELRTPLNAIIGFSTILREELFGPHQSPQYKEYAEDIQKSGEHLLQIIGDILDISKIEAGEMRLDFEQIDLVQILNSTVRMCQPRLREKSLKLRVKAHDEELFILGDELKMKQVFLNLLSNAIKFTDAGGISIETERAHDNKVRITMKDTGRGMSESDARNVLRPFVQANDILTRDNEGTGLGLALVDAFVTAHGGRLVVSSILNVGTTITVELPELIRDQVVQEASK